MSETNYEHVGRFIYSAHRYGGDVIDVENWMADDLGVARPAPGDENAALKRDLYLAFFAKYAREEAFQDNYARFVASLTKAGR